eukprot:CAMPEP_0181489252 /NCGR_PEP_ID=MMETSP1110-20121109/48862_1 /TAXON_ID=174948 /ORGANISM="Symbiodinium sp., Strain CCMP421" /LENGTH=54 /DNA_ID=CAMNT_0023616031 /DNA_START=12 /DNA_END=176 /DNA_ORIENTATION=-
MSMLAVSRGRNSLRSATRAACLAISTSVGLFRIRSLKGAAFFFKAANLVKAATR